MFKTLLLSIICSFGLMLSQNAYSEVENNKSENKEKTSKFEPGTFILDHILDEHEWHIATYGHTHISIPLPIIVYSLKQKKLIFFMSYKFDHGHSSHKGLFLPHDGPYKGKIVEVLDDGITIDEAAAKPLDFSITKNITSLFISVILLFLIFFKVASLYKKNRLKAPSGLQSFIEPLLLFLRDDVAKPAIGPEKYFKFMPFLLTIFFFIFLNNLLGLIPVFPGGANVTGNISITLILALFTFITITVNGNMNYWKHIFNAPGVPWWLKFPLPLMPIIEILGMFTKPFVLMVRLFANITAGHIIILGFFSLIFIFGEMSIVGGYGITVVSVAFGIFMSMLELLVAFIQAYVFTLLSAIYIGMAVEDHHHEHESIH